MDIRGGVEGGFILGEIVLEFGLLGIFGGDCSGGILGFYWSLVLCFGIVLKFDKNSFCTQLFTLLLRLKYLKNTM